MKDIWIVEGSTGEYSDHCYWQVYAFTTEEKAKEYAEALNSWCKENQVYGRDMTDRVSFDRPKECPLDPNFQCDYTGTHYYAFQLEIKE